MTQPDSEATASVNGAQGALWRAAGMRPCACGCGTLVSTEHRRKYVDGQHRLRAWALAQAKKLTSQRALPGESRVEREFEDWIETPAGRYVEAEVRRLALEDVEVGERHGEINFYLAMVRRESRGLTKDRRGYACNNSHRAYLARRLMEGVPQLHGFFKTRALYGKAA